MIVLRYRLNRAGWEPEKHPRDPHGEFASAAGGASGGDRDEGEPEHGVIAGEKPDRFAKVAPGVYRGGMPKSRDQWKYLQSLGVKSVMKFDGEDQYFHKPPPGIKVTEDPIDYKGTPSHEQIKRILDAIDAAPKPVFVHCWHGRDRTGLISGLYRVRHGASPEIEGKALIANGGMALPKYRGLWNAWVRESGWGADREAKEAAGAGSDLGARVSRAIDDTLHEIRDMIDAAGHMHGGDGKFEGKDGGGRDPRLPPAGTVLKKEHGGAVHEVVVGETGPGGKTAFTHRRPDGTTAQHTSLSKIAGDITGKTWNGYQYFNLKAPAAAAAAAAPAKAPEAPKQTAAAPASPKATEAPAATAPKAGEPKPLSAAAILGTKLAGASGSNAGGLYRGTDGVERYVKFYTDPSQAAGEHLANMLYRGAGIAAPKSALFDNGGKVGYASEIVPGLSTFQQGGLNPDKARKAMDGFTADVLTANWDAAGTGLDNMATAPDGHVYRIDNGSAFLHRAMGSRKPESKLDKPASEIDGFLNPSINPYYAKVAKMAGVSGREGARALVKTQLPALLDVRDKAGGWGSFVEKNAPLMPKADRARVAQMLDARTMRLQSFAGGGEP